MEAVRTSAFSGRKGDHDAFTFTSAYDGSGVPETRTRGLRRRGLLSENVLTRSSIDFLLGDADPELVHGSYGVYDILCTESSRL
ncbi:hypothetical protein PC112_g22170 [Phytophthora cactorum]|nr:hypothetical protein PC112_g22170 [Phytophthora cactorum]